MSCDHAFEVTDVSIALVFDIIPMTPALSKTRANFKQFQNLKKNIDFVNLEFWSICHFRIKILAQILAKHGYLVLKIASF